MKNKKTLQPLFAAWKRKKYQYKEVSFLLQILYSLNHPP